MTCRFSLNTGEWATPMPCQKTIDHRGPHTHLVTAERNLIEDREYFFVQRDHQTKADRFIGPKQ